MWRKCKLRHLRLSLLYMLDCVIVFGVMVRILQICDTFPPHYSQYGEAIDWIEYMINQQLASNYGIIQSGMYHAVISRHRGHKP